MTHPQQTSIVSFFAVALLLLAPAGAFAQTQGSSALDALCPTSYDYTCTFGQTDKQGKPCGQGLPVASTQVKGICVAGDKAQETSYENQNGQWVSGPQPNPQSGTAQTGTGVSGSASAQITPASTPNALTPTTPPEPQTQVTPQTGNTLVPGTSVLDNSLHFLTGQENAVPPGGVSNISPSDNENTIFNPQPLSQQPILPGGQAQALTSEPVAPGGATVPDTTYAPAFQSTISQPMGSLQGLTQQDIQSANSTANPSLWQQVSQDFQYFQNSFSGQQTPLDTSDVRATIYTPGAGGDNGGLYGSQGNLLNPNVPTVAAGYDSGYQYGQVLQITNPDTNQSVNAVVGDVCPGCKSGIDLTPAAANAIGFTQEQGVGTMQVAVVANTPNYSDGSQMTVALNQNSNALNPWSNAPVVSLATYVTQDYSPLSSQGDWAQATPESLPAYPVASVEGGSQLPEPVVPVEPNAAPYPTEPVASAPLLLSEQQIAANVPVPETVNTNPQAAIEQANNEALNQQLPTPQLVDTNPQAAIEQANNEALNQQLPVPQSVETNPQLAIEQANNQALSEQLPAPSPVQTNPQAAIEQANNAALNQQLPVPEQVQTNPQASIEAANQQAFQQIPQPDYVNVTPAQIAAEVAQTNPAASNEGLAFSPPGYQYDWANPSQNEALAYGSTPNQIVNADFNSIPQQGLTPQQIVTQEFGALPQAPNVLGEVPAATNPVFASYDSSGFTQQVTAQNAADQAQSPVTAQAGGTPDILASTGNDQRLQPANTYTYDSQSPVAQTGVSGIVNSVLPQTEVLPAAAQAQSTDALTKALIMNPDTLQQFAPGATVKSGDIVFPDQGTLNLSALQDTKFQSDLTNIVSSQETSYLAPSGYDSPDGVKEWVASFGAPPEAPASVSGVSAPPENLTTPWSSSEGLQGTPPLTAADLFPGENAAAWSEVALNDQAYNPSQAESLAYNSGQQQTGSVPAAAASDIASANPNDERLQQAQDQSEPQTIIPAPPTPMQSIQSKLNNALNYVQQAQASATNGGSNDLTQQQYNYLRSVGTAAGVGDSIPSYQNAASKFNFFGGWTGIAGSVLVSKIQNAVSNPGK